MVSKEFSVLEDSERKFSLRQVQELVRLGKFQANDQEVLTLGVTHSRYWLHARSGNWLGSSGILELDEPSLSIVKCYIINGGQVDSLQGGVAIHPSHKPFSGGRIAFPLEELNENQEVLIRIEGRVPILFSLNWYSQTDWESSQKRYNILMGAILSLFLMVVVFGATLLLIQKRFVYLWLLAYLVFFGTGLSLIYGMAYEFFYLSGGDRWVAVFMGGSQPMLLLAYRTLIYEQRPAFKAWRRGIEIALAVALVIFALPLIFGVDWVTPLVMFFIVTVAVGLLGTTVILHFRGSNGIILFLLPLSFHLLAILFGIFSRLGVIAISPGQKSIPLFCLIIEMILFLSMVHFQYSKMKKARAKAELLLERSQFQLDILRARLAGLGLREADSQPLEEDRSGIEQLLADEQLAKSLVNPLSTRELEVLNAVSKGLTNRQVAESLFISVNTVKTHLLNIYGKLDASNRTEAARKANQLNLLD